MVATTEVTCCPNCGDQRRVPLCRARDRLLAVNEQEFRYARCRRCGVCYQACRPVTEALVEFYPNHYGPYNDKSASGTGAASNGLGNRRRCKTLARRLAPLFNRWLRRSCPDRLPQRLLEWYQPENRGRVLLDFGCGSAAFLDQARTRGWDTVGADFQSEIVAQVRSGGHRACMVGAELEHSIPENSLDFVRMNHVVEHLENPRQTLDALSRKMKPGARIHMATPNAAALSFKVFGPRWFSLDCPRHLLLFTPAAIRNLLHSLGFVQIQVWQEVLTKDMARSLGYLLVDWRRLPHERVQNLAESGLLAELLFVPARLAALLGQADRIHVMATKRHDP